MRVLPLLLLFASFLLAADFPVGSKLDSIMTTRPHNLPAKVTVAFESGGQHEDLIAVIFVSAKSPVTQAYTARLNKLFRHYNNGELRDAIRFIFVDANSDESDTDLKYFYGLLDMEVTQDVNGILADRLNAQYTPEAFLFDKTGTLLYRGRVDDSRNPETVKSEDLRNAIDAAVANKPIPATQTKVSGDLIKRSANNGS